jgi:Erythromycin esterase
VNAHNGHLQRNKGTMRMGDLATEWWSAGAIVSARLGPDYAFLATAVGTISHHGVEAPPPDTLEGLLYASSGDCLIVDPSELPAGAPRRESPWYGYAPLDPTQVPTVDGVLFVRDASS